MTTTTRNWSEALRDRTEQFIASCAYEVVDLFLTVDPDTAEAGAPVAILVTASPADATGTVTITAGALTSPALHLVDGTADWATDDLPAGTHAVTALYTPGAGFAAGDVVDASVTITEAEPD